MIEEIRGMTYDELRERKFLDFSFNDSILYSSEDYFVYIDRRVSSVTAMYDREMYHIPHEMVDDDKETGDILKHICTGCYSTVEKLFDSTEQEWYCPRCDKV